MIHSVKVIGIGFTVKCNICDDDDNHNNDDDNKDYSQRLATFNTQVLKKVYAEIQYPTRAVRRGLQGRVELDVALRESGELLEITVVQSSGYKILDKAAVKAAGKALASLESSDLDPVAIAEYGDENEALVVPVPVQFMLTE